MPFSGFAGFGSLGSMHARCRVFRCVVRDKNTDLETQSQPETNGCVPRPSHFRMILQRLHSLM